MASPASDLHRTLFWRTGDPQDPYYIGSEQIRVKKVQATVVANITLTWMKIWMGIITEREFQKRHSLNAP